MATRSKKPARRKNSHLAIDRPFDPEILRQASEMAGKYRIFVRFSEGDYYGHARELPHVMNDAKTPTECIVATRDIITSLIASMLEDGQSPPPPKTVSRKSPRRN